MELRMYQFMHFQILYCMSANKPSGAKFAKVLGGVLFGGGLSKGGSLISSQK